MFADSGILAKQGRQVERKLRISHKFDARCKTLKCPELTREVVVSRQGKGR
jgi:hypothetical protein